MSDRRLYLVERRQGEEPVVAEEGTGPATRRVEEPGLQMAR